MTSSQIKKGAILSYAGVVFNALAGLIYTPWMISRIGADDYGLYTLALSVINFFLLDFGLGDAVSRYMSKYYAEGREDLANTFLGLAYKIYAVAAAMIFVCLLTVFLLIDQIYVRLSPEQLDTFKVLFAIAACYSVISFPFASFHGILISNERFVVLHLCNLLQKVFTVLFIVSALLCGMGVFALVIVNAGVGLVFTVVKYVIIRRTTSVRPVFRDTQRGMLKDVAGFSIWSMVVQICQRFIFSVMPTILAVVANTWEIAVFGLAASLEGYVWTVANALNSMFMPRVSRVLAGDKSEGTLQELSAKIGRIQLFVVGGIIVAFAAIGSRFVNCWVGPEYSTLFACALLLIIPSAIDLPLMIANTAVIAAGEVRARGTVYIVMSVINLLLGFVLSGMFGAVGACLSICIAYLIRTAGMCVIYTKRIHIDLKLFTAQVFPKWMIVAAVSFLAGCVASRALPIGGWVGFLLTAVVFCIVYYVSSQLFFFNAYEKGLMNSIFGRLFRKER